MKLKNFHILSLGLMVALTGLAHGQTYPRGVAPARMPVLDVPVSTVPAGEAKPIPRYIQPTQMQLPVDSAPVPSVTIPHMGSAPTVLQTYPAATYPAASAPLSAPGYCADCEKGHGHGSRVGPTSTYGERLRAAWYVHICAPDGCPTPLGCGNFWTEKKFIFGSCRQFFGTAGASEGHHKNTYIP
ncbi:MAG: hypothetical protein R3B84_21230 [Zavarzinella sp.]